MSPATEPFARLLRQQVYAHGGIRLSVEAHDALPPVTTLTSWRQVASDRTAVNIHSRPDQEPHGWIGKPYGQAMLRQPRALQRHRHLLADVLRRIASRSKPHSNYPVRT